MRKRRRIIFVVYDRFELLDMSGPVSVFMSSNNLGEKPSYDVVVASQGGGYVVSSAGIEISAQALQDLNITKSDTILAMGANSRPLRTAMQSEFLREWLKGPATKAERLGSVCSGAFLLAVAGVLDGKRSVTHWMGCRELQQNFPKINVDPDALYVTDGMFWTSAGVTTGIDMALAMLESDLGTTHMLSVARRLVVYARRPGNQSQFSSLLDAQSTGGEAFADVIAWIDANLEKTIKVSDMAEQACMSERSFYRKFTDAMGLSPHKFLIHARLDRGRQLLELGVPVKTIVGSIGYDSELGFRSAFEARFNISPALHKRMHAGLANPTTISN